MDNRAGARLVTRHLLDLGHSDIAFITGPRDSPEAAARLRSWRDEMKSAGLAASRVYPGDWSSATGFDAGRRIVADGLPTAVFAGNDQMALGLLSALGAAGVDVPDDVSVAGFDDLPDAEFFQPGLTTVRQDFATLAARCVGVLERILAGEQASSVCISGELVIRESTAPPRGRKGTSRTRDGRGVVQG